jgi:hypothetical protein
MKSNRHFLKDMCVAVCWSFVIAILILSSPAQATNGCYKYITFKNESAYIANATVWYTLDGHKMTQKTGDFPTGKEKRVPLPCSATSIEVLAHAVGGHDIFRMELGNAQDRCFKLKGMTLNTRYESCDPRGTTPSCYKHITIKNQGGYVADASVSYTYNNLSSTHPTGHFPAGQSKRVAVPCDAKSVRVSAELVDVFQGDYIFSDWLQIVEDRCYALKGTSYAHYYESCEPSETLPPIDCWKHVTLKNESAYIVNVGIEYWIGDRRKAANTGDFPHGKVKRIAVPCISNSKMKANVVAGSYLREKDLNKNQDYCFVFRGTTGNPRYEPCVKEQTAAEPKHDITIRNHGAYATELTIHYDLNYERKSAKKVIQTQQHGGLSIPLEAKNVQVTAKAIAGKQIFEKIFPAAESYCREVKGTTLFPKHEPCN